jgi:hypothetical protein
MFCDPVDIRHKCMRCWFAIEGGLVNDYRLKADSRVPSAESGPQDV